MSLRRVFPLIALIVLIRAGGAAAQETAPDGNRSFRWTPGAYVQLDFRSFAGWHEVAGTGDLIRQEVEVRRLRGQIEGRWRRMSFEVSVDPEDPDGRFVKDTYLDLRFDNGFRVRGGQFKVPNSREYLVGARRLDFLERSALATSLAAGRDVGFMITGRAGRTVSYQGGLFAGDGVNRGSRAGLTAAGRVEWSARRNLDVGVTVTEGRTRAVDSDPENGLDGRAPSGYRFFDELYVQGRRSRIGGDVEWERGRWHVTAEAQLVRDERREQGLDFEDLPALVGTGWSVSLRRRFGVRKGAPDRPWDVAVRYERLAYDDAGPETGRDSVRPRATDVRARAVDVLTSGVSWRLSRWMRLITNAGIERYLEARLAPNPGQRNYFTFGSRLQLELP